MFALFIKDRVNYFVFPSLGILDCLYFFILSKLFKTTLSNHRQPKSAMITLRDDRALKPAFLTLLLPHLHCFLFTSTLLRAVHDFYLLKSIVLLSANFKLVSLLRYHAMNHLTARVLAAMWQTVAVCGDCSLKTPLYFVGHHSDPIQLCIKCARLKLKQIFVLIG